MPRSFFVRFIAALILLTGLSARAAEFKFLMNSDFYGYGRGLMESAANPNNQVLNYPSTVGVIDIKPDFSLLLGSRVKFVLRPRWTGEAMNWNDGPQKDDPVYVHGKADLTDAFGEFTLTRRLRAIAGLEVYQWGPAEFLNVSNPFYHLSRNARSPFFKEKGQVLARVSWDATSTWNNMLIVNPMSNAEPAWRAGDEFEPMFALKTEYRNRNGTFYVGFLGGQENDRLPFVGEYLNLSFASGFSVYTESRHTRGDLSYFPARDQYGFYEMINDPKSQKWVHQSLLGMRYENVVDVRWEFIVNSSGFNKQDFENGIDSISRPSPYIYGNFARFLQPGMELYGQLYSYLSLRIADLGRRNDLTLFFRNLTSIQDGSGTLQFAFEKPVGDAVTVLGDATTTFGGQNKELTLADQYVVSLGLRWTL